MAKRLSYQYQRGLYSFGYYENRGRCLKCRGRHRCHHCFRTIEVVAATEITDPSWYLSAIVADSKGKYR